MPRKRVVKKKKPSKKSLGKKIAKRATSAIAKRRARERALLRDL